MDLETVRALLVIAMLAYLCGIGTALMLRLAMASSTVIVTGATSCSGLSW